ncbi:hypothetical protein DNK57_06370 [Methanothermobacter thermautotrophicus]|uniref:Uncharacterized protein n=1 Tax=Methanothermobacter thermautotrophicus TaxID=145262 RepID=A0A842YP80_METTF|nr:hypothetical protein [Methanothermobacter thermautotrophicus]MBE2900420.1 hypothetical protein [Methanothermobacter thermautotrophicus]MCQ8905359.1 hypothetical protein [Methanothermobacter sp.]
MDIDIEQCRENDKIKEIISSSGLPIKYIKLLLRLSDGIYINGVNYNVKIEDGISVILISSKPENRTGVFRTGALTNIFYRVREMEKENEEIRTETRVKDNLIELRINIQ